MNSVITQALVLKPRSSFRELFLNLCWKSYLAVLGLLFSWRKPLNQIILKLCCVALVLWLCGASEFSIILVAIFYSSTTYEDKKNDNNCGREKKERVLLMKAIQHISRCFKGHSLCTNSLLRQYSKHLDLWIKSVIYYNFLITICCNSCQVTVEN